MAITGRKRVVKITIAAATFSSNVTSFPVPINQLATGFPAEIWSGDNHCDPTGEDIAFSTDLAGLNQIPAEKQFFDFAANTCKFVVKIPTGNSAAANEIYMHYGKALQTFPARTDPFGSDNVYRSEYAFFSHQNATAGAAIDVTSYNVSGAYVGANFPEAINPGAYHISNEFDSVDSNRVNWAHGTHQWINGAFSLGSIVYAAGFGSNHTFIGKRADAGTFAGYEAYTNIAGGITFVVDYGTEIIQVSTTNPISLTTYYWVDITWDGVDANSVKILLNGVPQAVTIGTNTTNTYPTNTNNFGVGARNGSTATNEMNGRQEECYIYHGQLSDAWCLARYRLQSAQATYVSVGTPANSANYLLRNRITKCRTHGTYIDADLTQKDLLIDERQITQVMWAEAKSNGGDILAFTSSAKTTQIPIEVVVWDPVNQLCEIWVAPSTVLNAGGNEVWLAYDGDEDYEQPFRDTTYGMYSVWDANYVGVWHQQEVGAGVANEYLDSSGTLNHGQGANAPTRVVSGIVQKGQQGNGVNQRIVVGDVSFPSGNAASTQEGWAVLDGGTSEETPMGYGTTVNGQRRVLQQRTEGIGIHVSGHFWGITTRQTGRTYMAGVFPSGGTQSNQFLFYLNGVLQTSVNLSGTSQVVNTVKNWSQLHRGTDGAYSSVPIDECRISNIARAAEWLKVTNYNIINTNNIWNETFLGIQQLEIVGGGALKAAFTEVTADYYNVYARPDNASVFSSAYLIGKFPAASVVGKVFFRAIADGKTLLNSMHNYYVGVRAEYQGTEEQNEVVLYVRPVGGEPVFVNDRHVGIIP